MTDHGVFVSPMRENMRKVGTASAVLEHTNKKAAHLVRKVLLSAVANAENNVGADVVTLVAARRGHTLRSTKQQAFVAEVRLGDARVALAFPQTYMNESGRSVQLLTKRHGIDDPERLVVIHDELDLPTGRVKLKVGGGLAGL